jgi:hypothetical protein
MRLARVFDSWSSTTAACLADTRSIPTKASFRPEDHPLPGQALVATADASGQLRPPTVGHVVLLGEGWNRNQTLAGEDGR